ncbi:hypothetical protein C8R46DRAFT_1015685 [Mycena filopes]|nr:hypothetical protein C8R46DRAFT_1015685 [Mycena filopes]
MTSMASPFASKLGTNYCPKDEEVVEIKSLLVEPALRWKRLDDEITELQHAINKLAAERYAVGAFIDGHQALISPARRLPLDIIQEIFVACLPTHRNCVMSASEAPVLLGRICSGWRSIALNTPRLWCRLHIVEPARAGGSKASAILEEKLAQRLETTKMWLGRSGQCPLSISLQSSQGISPLPHTHFNFVPVNNTRLFMQALIPFAPRWQNLTLWISWSALETLSTLTESDVPLLRRLEISQRPDPAIPAIQWSTFGLFRAPNLSDFTFSGAQMSIIELGVQWANLTHLSLMGHGWGVLPCRIALEVLSRSPQVQVCRLLVNEDNTDMTLTAVESAGRAMIELPFLHSLHVTSLGLPPHGLGSMFSRLVVPALRQFELRGRSNMNVENPTLVASFVTFLATAVAFQSLHIDTQIFTKESLVGIVRGLPTTTTRLDIMDRPRSWGSAISGILSDDTIAELIPTPEHPGSCPLLQELRITRCLCPSDAVLLRLITARMASSSTLRSINIQFNRERQVDITGDIQPFVDAGLKVTTAYMHSQVVGNFSPWQGLADAPTTHWDMSPLLMP